MKFDPVDIIESVKRHEKRLNSRKLDSSTEIESDYEILDNDGNFFISVRKLN